MRFDWNHTFDWCINYKNHPGDLYRTSDKEHMYTVVVTRIQLILDIGSRKGNKL